MSENGDREDTVTIEVSMSKKTYDFLREFAGWTGHEDQYFISEMIEESLKSHVEGLLDCMKQINELHDKIEYFEERYGFKAC